jgi:hypothetical protein
MKRSLKIIVAVALLSGLAVHTRLYLQDDTATQEQRFLTNNEVLALLTSQIASESVARTAQFLLTQEIPLRQKIEIMRALVADPSYGFTHDDLIMLILAVANGYPARTPEQQAIFKILADNYDTLQDTRPLAIAAQHKYYNVLESLATWALDNVEHYKQLKADLTALKMVALANAMENETSSAFRGLVAQLGGITPQQATDLAWKQLARKGSVEFMAELKQLGANLEDARNGKTMLVYAVMDNNLPMVQALTKLGVNLSSFADPEIGTPLQQAFSLGYKDIEKFLRSQGAREI